MRIAITIVLCLTLTSCAAFSQLARAAAGSQWLDSVIGLATTAAEQHLVTRPDSRAPEVAAAGLELLRAKAAYDRAIASGQDGTAEKAALVEAWARYAELLTELGVTRARYRRSDGQQMSPALELPDAAEVAERL